MNVSISHPAAGKSPQPNFTEVSIGGCAFYFSYETCIAFNLGGYWVVRENEWGPTTGKHLNYIDNGEKSSRISGEDFERRLSLLNVTVDH